MRGQCLQIAWLFFHTVPKQWTSMLAWGLKRATLRACAPLDGGSRFIFIDGLRGIAALWVALFHLYSGGPNAPVLASLTPGILDAALRHGYLGVEVFFVISGFVIAHSVGSRPVTRDFALRFAARRSLRLDPPYWLTIILVVFLDA